MEEKLTVDEQRSK